MYIYLNIPPSQSFSRPPPEWWHVVEGDRGRMSAGVNWFYSFDSYEVHDPFEGQEDVAGIRLEHKTTIEDQLEEIRKKSKILKHTKNEKRRRFPRGRTTISVHF